MKRELGVLNESCAGSPVAGRRILRKSPRWGWWQVGGASVFEPFFKHFIQKHASSAVDSNQFKEDFLEFFAGNANIHQIDWEVSVKQP
jgi:hypothetical protein